MNSYLEKLGVHPRVRHFFKPYLTQTNQEIIFKYGDDTEHAGNRFHRIPITEHCWTAGSIEIASHVVIAGSAMDAMAWLHFNQFRFRSIDQLLFISTGACSSLSFAVPFPKNTPKKIHLIFSNDSLGAIFDLKTAACIRGFPLKIKADRDHFLVTFKSRTYALQHPSLHALEKAAGFHFNIRTHKPKNAATYYEQLRNRHPP